MNGDYENLCHCSESIADPGDLEMAAAGGPSAPSSRHFASLPAPRRPVFTKLFSIGPSALARVLTPRAGALQGSGRP